jgi:hypothetical protein
MSTVIRPQFVKDSTDVLLDSLAGLAGVMGAQAQPLQAARLFGTVDAVRATIGVHTRDPADRTEYERNVANVRAQLGAATFAAAWAEGQAMTLEEAVVDALSVRAE